ncbi:MAG: hypothetical protein ACLTK0_07925 [Anaerovoracaceae bacterium]
MSKEDVITDVMDDEGIEELKDKISDIKEELIKYFPTLLKS